jgi:hypothetical protein
MRAKDASPVALRNFTFAPGGPRVGPRTLAHIANNESGVTTETSVVYFGVPEGTSPRIDEPAPGNCDF